MPLSRLPALLAATLLLTALPARADQQPAWFAGMLEAHNAARRAVGVPPLRWSAAVAAVAQRWADRLGSAGCPMRHSGTEDYGENLAWAASQQLSPAEVVGLWVAEASAYHPASGACTPGAVCGHYTQIVWRSTRVVGCGYAPCGNSEVWVCNYDPPGNYQGERAY